MNITEKNYQIANDLTRDILYMYIDLVESYKGFGHGIDTGEFVLLNFVDVNVIEPEGVSFGIDVTLLQSGSGIGLLCVLSDAWDEYGTYDVHWPLVPKIKLAYENSRFSHLPEINKAVELGFGQDEEAFRKQLEVVYRKHVCAYFSRLAKDC